MAIDDSYYIDEWERRKMERVRSRRGGEEKEGGKIEVWRKGRRNGKRDRERPGKGGEERM